MRSVQEILSRCFLSGGILNTALKSTQYVFNAVFNSTANALNISIDGFSIGNLATQSDSIEVEKGEGILLPEKNGKGKVWIDDNSAEAVFDFSSTGAVTLRSSVGEVANSDTALKLCIYEGIIKNNLGADGSSQVINYELKYSNL